jgi:hypothetical protein
VGAGTKQCEQSVEHTDVCIPVLAPAQSHHWRRATRQYSYVRCRLSHLDEPCRLRVLFACHSVLRNSGMGTTRWSTARMIKGNYTTKHYKNESVRLWWDQRICQYKTCKTGGDDESRWRWQTPRAMGNDQMWMQEAICTATRGGRHA